MSVYVVNLKRQAIKDLKQIDKQFHRLIKRRIKILAENPLPRGVKKLSDDDSMFRIRQGKFRIIYTIDFEALIVRVLAVEHRKEAYRKI